MTNSKNTDHYTPHWKLRRLAPRALRVLEAHGKSTPFLGAFEATLPPAAQKFIEAFDASRIAEAASDQVKDGLQAVERLRSSVRGWLGHVQRDIPDFDAVGLGAAEVPDDLIAGATRMIQVLTSPTAAELSYVAAAEADLRATVEAATQEWGKAQARLAEQQRLLKVTRGAASAFQVELVAFRRALRVAIGTTHRDYQSLRVREGGELDNEPDAPAPTGDSDGSTAPIHVVPPSATSAG